VALPVRCQLLWSGLITHQAQIVEPVDLVMESILEPASFDPQPNVELLNACPLLLPPPALDFMKFQEARARFNSAFIGVCSPAFEMVTRTVLPVLQSLQAAVAPLAPPAAPLVPSVSQPCALASIPIPMNPFLLHHYSILLSRSSGVRNALLHQTSRKLGELSSRSHSFFVAAAERQV
jgi:hypothetical protein